MPCLKTPPVVESTSPKFQNGVPERVEVRPLSQPREGIEGEWRIPNSVIVHFVETSDLNWSGEGRVAVLEAWSWGFEVGIAAKALLGAAAAASLW